MKSETLVINVVKKENTIKYIGDYNEGIQSIVKDYLASKKLGKYSLRRNTIVVNGSVKSNIEEISYKEVKDIKTYLLYGAAIVGGVIYYFVQ